MTAKNVTKQRTDNEMKRAVTVEQRAFFLKRLQSNGRGPHKQTQQQTHTQV